MKSFRNLIIFLLPLITIDCFSEKWKLVWREDFNKKYLDENNWSLIPRGNEGWRNKMTLSDSCYYFKNGKLNLLGIVNTNNKDTLEYLTAGIETKNKKAFKAPLKIEVRAKLKGAQGAWPAIWMMPFDLKSPWPASGEIDIIEYPNYEEFVYQTVHTDYTIQFPNKPQYSVKSKIKSNKFNIYGVEIVEDKLIFYVNGEQTLFYPNLFDFSDNCQFPFIRDWYLKLDMQLGGDGLGEIDPNTLPAVLEIDWVKYYQPK